MDWCGKGSVTLRGVAEQGDGSTARLFSPWVQQHRRDRQLPRYRGLPRKHKRRPSVTGAAMATLRAAPVGCRRDAKTVISRHAHTHGRAPACPGGGTGGACERVGLTSRPASPGAPASPGGPMGPGGPRSPDGPPGPCFPGSPYGGGGAGAGWGGTRVRRRHGGGGKGV